MFESKWLLLARCDFLLSWTKLLSGNILLNLPTFLYVRENNKNAFWKCFYNSYLNLYILFSIYRCKWELPLSLELNGKIDLYSNSWPYCLSTLSLTEYYFTKVEKLFIGIRKYVNMWSTKVVLSSSRCCIFFFHSSEIIIHPQISYEQ